MRIPGLILLALLAGCFSLDGFLFNPKKLASYSFPDDDAKASRELVQLSDEDGVKIWALWLPRAKLPASGQPKTVLYCHGNDADMEEFYWRVKLIRDQGYDVLLFDYRGYGASEGEPSEEGLYRDARAALAEAQRRATGPIVYYGFSLGAAVCTQLAVEQHPAALHLDAPFASIDRMAKDNSDLPLPGGYISHWRFDNLHKIDKIGAPLQIFHGEADDFLRPEYGEELYRRALEPKQFWKVPGAGHATLPNAPGYVECLTAFLEHPEAPPAACP